MRIGQGRIHEIVYTPDGTGLAVASGIGVWLYDTATHKEADLLAGNTDVDSIAFSPDGSTIAGASWDDDIRLWDAATGKHLQTLNGHTREVYCVAVPSQWTHPRQWESGRHRIAVATVLFNRIWGGTVGKRHYDAGEHQTDSVAAKLSQSVQPRNLDTVSVGKRCTRDLEHL